MSRIAFAFVGTLALSCLSAIPLSYGGTLSGTISKLNGVIPTNIQIDISPPVGTSIDKSGLAKGKYTVTLQDGVNYTITVNADDSLPAQLIGLNGSSNSASFNLFLPNPPTNQQRCCCGQFRRRCR